MFLTREAELSERGEILLGRLWPQSGNLFAGFKEAHTKNTHAHKGVFSFTLSGRGALTLVVNTAAAGGLKEKHSASSPQRKKRECELLFLESQTGSGFRVKGHRFCSPVPVSGSLQAVSPAPASRHRTHYSIDIELIPA